MKKIIIAALIIVTGPLAYAALQKYEFVPKQAKTISAEVNNVSINPQGDMSVVYYYGYVGGDMETKVLTIPRTAESSALIDYCIAQLSQSLDLVDTNITPLPTKEDFLSDK